MSELFSPITLRDVTFENRIVVSPMCEYSCVDGVANDWHLVNLGQYALSGPGLVTIEATAVSPEARITDCDLGLYSDACEAGLQRTVDFIRRWTQSKIALQLAHAGRKASVLPPWEGGGAAEGTRSWRAVSASAIPYGDWPAPQALDAAGLQKIRDDFAAATRRCVALDVDVIELHFAHGYLIHQFLSPLTNARDDEYGGSLENRMRFALEIFDIVREIWPAGKPLGVRVSASDWAEGGWDIDQTIALVRELQTRACDFVDTSSGGLVPYQKIAVGPGYQVPFSLSIKRATGITTMAVGMITQPEQAESIVASGEADFVALARGFIRHPRWTWDAADALGGDAFVPPQYARGRKL